MKKIIYLLLIIFLVGCSKTEEDWAKRAKRLAYEADEKHRNIQEGNLNGLSKTLAKQIIDKHLFSNSDKGAIYFKIKKEVEVEGFKAAPQELYLKKEYDHLIKMGLLTISNELYGIKVTFKMNLTDKGKKVFEDKNDFYYSNKPIAYREIDLLRLIPSTNNQVKAEYKIIEKNNNNFDDLYIVYDNNKTKWDNTETIILEKKNNNWTVFVTWALNKGKDPMKFNLKKQEGARTSPILVTNIDFALHKDPSAELEEKRGQLTDIVSKFFNSKTAEQVRLSQHQFIKDELRRRINDVLTDDVAKIENIFFREYFVQE